MERLTPREKKSIETKEKILDTVGYILNQYELKNLTVRNICEQTEISTGSFYNFFENKENVLFEYTKRQFAEVLAKNPLPQFLNPDDFIKRTVWPFLVYAVYCASMGKSYMRYLYQNCESDVFVESCFDTVVEPSLRAAFEQGDLSRDEKRPEMLGRLMQDMKIIIRGAVWCWSSEKENIVLPTIVEQVISRILLATASEKYHELITTSGYYLISDTEGLVEKSVRLA
jgi:AcrR family transcriptional regulator